MKIQSLSERIEERLVDLANREELEDYPDYEVAEMVIGLLVDLNVSPVEELVNRYYKRLQVIYFEEV